MMADVSKKRRRFRVWLDKKISGKDATEIDIDVEPGEDASVACIAALDNIIENECETGWEEIEDEKASGR